MHEAMLACPQNPFMRDIRPDAAIARRSAAQLALAGYAVFFAIFFSPVSSSGGVLAPVDSFRFHYPHYWLPRALWDPNLATGFPVAADPQVMTWYPPAIILSWVPHSWNLFVVTSYVLASWFTFLYVQTLTRRVDSALVAGFVFGVSGFMCAQLGHAAIIHAAMWLPALLLSIAKLSEQRGVRWMIATAAAVVCCVTAGHLQIAVYSLSIAAAYAIAIRKKAADPVGFFWTATAAMGLGLAATAMQLLPTLELAGESTRHSLTFSEFAGYSLHPHQLLTFLFPYILGGFGGHFYQGPYFGPGAIEETTGYVGTGALVLAAIAFVSAWRQTVVRFWSAVCVLALLLSFGGATPLGPLLYRLPIFNLFQAQGRFLMLVDFSVAVLAGLGLDAVLHADQPRRWLKLATLAGPATLAIGVVGIGLFRHTLRRHAIDGGFPAESLIRLANNAIRVPLVAGALVAVSLFIVLNARRSAIARAMLITTIVFELVSVGFFQAWRYLSPPASVLEMPSEQRDLRERLRADGGRWLPVAGVLGTPSTLPPDISSFWDVPSASKFGPLMPRRYSELLGIGAASALVGSWGAYENRALDLAGVRYVAMSPPQQYVDGRASLEFRAFMDNVADGRRWRLVRTVSDVQVFENLRALPRAWLAPRAATLTPSQIVETIHTSRLPGGSPHDPRTVALIEQPVTIDARDVGADGRVQWLESRSSLVELETDSSSGAFLVLGDLFYPGWIATVDGRQVSVLRTNAIQRGVVVPAGRHRVRFTFRPRSFLVGASISAVAVLALVTFAAMQAAARRGSSNLGTVDAI
jgi:hypothetical protein